MFPLQIFPVSRKLYIAGAVFAVSLLLSGVFLYEMYARPLPQGHGAAAAPSGTVYLSAAGAAAAQASAPKKEPMLEVHIANNGLTLLRGARVLSILGNEIRVGMAWGSSDFTWVASTSYNSKFLTATGEKATLSDIKVGDIVTVTGTLSSGGTVPVINAEYIREQ